MFKKKKRRLTFSGGPWDDMELEVKKGCPHFERVLVDGYPYECGIPYGTMTTTWYPYHEDFDHANKRIAQKKADIRARELANV
jgi:hypothetical protein